MIRTLDIGNLLHGAIEILSGRLAKGEPSVNWHDITDQRLESLARESLRASLVREHASDLYFDSRRFEETYARCEGIFLRFPGRSAQAPSNRSALSFRSVSRTRMVYGSTIFRETENCSCTGRSTG